MKNGDRDGDIIDAGGDQGTLGRRGRGIRAAVARLPVRNRVLFATPVIIVAAAAVAIAAGLIGPGAGPSANLIVIREVTGVPASVLDSVGAGDINPDIVQVGDSGLVSGPAILLGGKPQVLYVGADYCPVLRRRAVGSRRRAEPLRHDLRSQSDPLLAYVPPADIPELSFYGSSYSSRFVSFTSVDTASSIADPHARPPYAPLQTLTAGQRAMMLEHDPSMAVPFLRIGNYVQVGMLIPALGLGQYQYSISSLSHKTWAQVAAALRDPASSIGRYLDGSADFLTAAICKYTGNQPADACTTQIRALEKDLVPAP